MARRVAAVLVLLSPLLLLPACAPQPVSDELTVEFTNGDAVVVTAETTFTLKPANDQVAARVESARSAAQTETDPWAVRFGALTPESERETFQRDHGTLERVTRSVRIPSRDLQHVFSDAHITVNVLQGEGWRELEFYPGTSIRASREQVRHFDENLTAWSAVVAKYFMSVDLLYHYMDQNPARAQDLFRALLEERDAVYEASPPVILEIEEPLVEDVRSAMEVVATRMDEDQGHADTFAEEADLIFNPFPARLTVKVPKEVLSTTGFGKDLTVEPVNLFDAITGMEGRWISPDPLSQLLRDEKPSPPQLARQDRKSKGNVQASEVADAIREQLARPKTYVVRWRD
jgi:hypothetical protein